MAGKDSTTFDWREAAEKIIPILRAVRAAGDLLCAASVAQETYTLHEATLVDLGSHLEDLAAEGLVILRYDSPKEEAKPQAVGQGGE